MLLFDNICRKSNFNIKHMIRNAHYNIMAQYKWIIFKYWQDLIFDYAQNSAKINFGAHYVIEEGKSVKYLGLIVDSLLKFDPHSDHIIKKYKNE